MEEMFLVCPIVEDMTTVESNALTTEQLARRQHQWCLARFDKGDSETKVTKKLVRVLRDVGVKKRDAKMLATLAVSLAHDCYIAGERP